MAARKPKDRTPSPRSDEAKKAEKPQTGEWDNVDESSWESFPASDPPSWIGQRSSEPSKTPRERPAPTNPKPNQDR